MGYDLTLQTVGTRDKHRAEQTMTALAAEVPSSAGWEPRLAFSDPDEEDCIFVEEALEEDEGEAEQFRELCRQRGITAEVAVSDPEVCASFVDEQCGAQLVTVTLPRQEPESAFAALVAFARRRGLALFDPQVGAAVDLDSPGPLPQAY